MSLSVTDHEVRLAQHGELTLEQFVEVVKRSLPYFWERVERLVAQLKSGVRMADDNSTPVNDEQRGQLLRGAASDAIRGAVQQHFGITLAFQNCCRLAAVWRGDEAALAAIRSVNDQVCNQRPDLTDC